MRRLFLILLWLGLATLPTATAGQPVATPVPVSGPTAPSTIATPGPGPQRTSRIEAELVPMSAWAAPGSTAIVAVRQDIQPGWHTYWRNPGDSGGPTSLRWSLPQGVRAGEIVWPLPQRQRLMTLMNYGYTGEVFLPVPIEIPATARPGTSLTLSVQTLFLVCSDEMCVPDELTLTLDLPVREGAAPLAPAFGAAIQTVVETAPRPAGIEARATLSDGVLTLSATGGPLAAVDIKRASFFPDVGRVIDHAADQTGARGPSGLSLSLTPGADLRANGLTGPITGVLATDAGAWEITATPGPPLPGTTGEGALSPTRDAAVADDWTWAGVVQAAVFALLGGLILNLMPCVFPILAMKAAALTRSAADPGEARRDGLAFTAGVLVTFAVLAGVLLALRAGGQAVGWGFQLQTPAVVAVLALILLAAGLNLSGVFHMGGALQAVGSSRFARLPGGAGAFFTGVLAVIVAAPCTAPFMAVALGVALVLPAPLALAIFLLLGLGLALPYLALSLSPGLLRRLPRPGPWMETLRGVLAFPMYAAAAWLVWVFARQTGGDALAVLLAATVTAALALWLVGRAQGAERGRVFWIAAALALIAAVTLTVVAARMAPMPTGGAGAGSAPGTTLASQPWSPEAVQAAQAEGRPVLVNFTADWCVTCKINERTALGSPRVARAVTEANAVYLVADWTRRDDAITRELQRHGRSGVPLYLAYAPGGGEPTVLPQLLTEGVVMEALAAR